MNPVTLYIVDDYLLTRISSRKLFENDNNFKILGDFSSAKECLENMEKQPSDIVLMDIELPDINGIEATKIIKEKYPNTKVIIFTSHQNRERILACLSCGAYSYVLKDNKNFNIKKIIDMAINGKIILDLNIAQAIFSAIPRPEACDLDNLYTEKNIKNNLTKREMEVLKLIIEGKTNSQIAQEMVVSINTAKAHVGKILNKLSATDRVQAAVKAVRAKIF